MRGFEANDLAPGCAVDRSTQPFLKRSRVPPPGGLPERLADHGVRLNAGESQSGLVRLEQRAVQRQEADELERLVEDAVKPALGSGQPVSAQVVIAGDQYGKQERPCRVMNAPDIRLLRAGQ